MTSLLIKLFIKNNDDIQNPVIRQRYGTLSGFVGIFCNVMLFTAKLLAGLASSSISIMADAFNNLSDAGSSIVTLAGFKIAGTPADDEHPFGHGRMEYISGLVVALAILLMGIEILRTSFGKVFHPDTLTFSFLPIVIMSGSILVKLWMWLFNRKMGKTIHSPALEATAVDSLSDVLSTSTVLFAILINKYLHVNVDGIAGCIVAGFILFTGYGAVKDTLNPLLGQAPDPEFVQDIERRVLSYSGIVGIHDLIVHNYGPGKSLISLHAEVPCTIDILKIHDTIDNIERDLKTDLNCEAVIHMDPIVTDDRIANAVHIKIIDIIKSIDPILTIHDFRMVSGPSHTNLIFDVVTPHKYHLSDEALTKKIADTVSQYNNTYRVVITVDKAYAMTSPQ